VFVLWATIIKEAQSQNYNSLGDLYIRIYLELALPSIFSSMMTVAWVWALVWCRATCLPSACCFHDPFWSAYT